MTTDRQQPIESKPDVEMPAPVTIDNAVTDDDMAYFSPRIDDLRTGNSPPPNVPDLILFDPKLQSQDGITNPDLIRFLQSPSDAASGLPGGSTWNKEDPSSALSDFLKKYSGDEPSEQRLRSAMDDLLVSPPREMDQLPPPQEQARLKEQARQIADMIRKNGDFYAGMKRENIEAMFESATRAGEVSLNFLVQSVNSELARTNPELQLEYSFRTDKAWYGQDTGGRDIYIRPTEVDENRSTVALSRRQNGTITTEDRIRSYADRQPPGYYRTEDPNRLPVLE